MIGFFVTGTDTGVGKTHVAVELVRRAIELGQSVFAFKPIETGCGEDGLGPDQEALCKAAGGWQTGPLCGVYGLRRPVAPFVAAEAASIVIDLNRIVSVALEGGALAKLTIIEGAGGWRVPLTKTADISTLACMLRLPVLLVARPGLGTINHSLLSLEAIERQGARVAALVLSCHPEDDRGFARSNGAEIQRRWPGSILIYEGEREVFDPLLKRST